jgi:hypothetical protein
VQDPRSSVASSIWSLCISSTDCIASRRSSAAKERLLNKGRTQGLPRLIRRCLYYNPAMMKSLLALTVVLAAIATIPTFGANRPVINSVTVDTTLQQLNISGVNLIGNKPTTVLFNDDTLQLESVSSTLVVAKLSPFPPAGSYLLALSTGNGSSDFDTFKSRLGLRGRRDLPDLVPRVFWTPTTTCSAP